MGVSGTNGISTTTASATTAAVTSVLNNYEAVAAARTFRSPSLEAADSSLHMGSLSPVDEQEQVQTNKQTKYMTIRLSWGLWRNNEFTYARPDCTFL